MKNLARAFLFDLNGTMVDDMRYHVQAWHDILNNDLQANFSLEDVHKQMYGKNTEVFVRFFGKNHLSDEQMEHWSIEKEKRYQKNFLPHLKLIDGLDGFLKQAKAKKIKMGIGSAALPFNIDFVLDNLDIRHYFDAIVSADDVAKSKPDAETYLKAAALLNEGPANCIVFEDAPMGVEAALSAGMRAVVLTTMHNRNEFDNYDNVLAFVKDYQEKYLKSLFI